MRPVRAVLFSLCLVAVGCASHGSDDFADPDVAAAATNPDGAPYPTDAIGASARAGGRRGERLPNLSFQGYRDGNRAAGLQTISIADYYDPAQTRHKLLHLQVAATWCVICSSESDATVKVKEPLGKEGAVFLQIVVNGNTSAKGPSLGEFDDWITRHGANYSIGMDVRARRLGGLGIDGVPWNLLIDTRTMEILHSSAGAPDDLVAYVKLGLDWVRTHPGSY